MAEQTKVTKGKKVSVPEKAKGTKTTSKTPSVGGKDVLKAYGIGKGSESKKTAIPKKDDKWKNDQSNKKKVK